MQLKTFKYVLEGALSTIEKDYLEQCFHGLCRRIVGGFGGRHQVDDAGNKVQP